VNWHFRFSARTSLNVFPLKGDFPISRIWKITPREKTSEIGLLLVERSLMLTIYGDTNPGVPHLV
jgi:hypothetical protein